MFDFLKNNVFGIIACVLVAILLFSQGGSQAADAPDNLGSNALTTFTNPVEFQDPLVAKEFTQGGGILNVIDTNGGTYALTQAELLASNVLEMNAGGAGQAVIALTLPATSTWTTLIPDTGDFREWVIDASALSAATTTTVTAGTGIDLLGVTTADDVIDGVEFARLSCWRKENTDVACITSELLRAD